MSLINEIIECMKTNEKVYEYMDRLMNKCTKERMKD